ncbi:MAG: 4Fe-4S dicluster domain-containing protein [Ruminococcaceae bacterium]|nr:4Fe-4S dicluster domain-containing protein [Oscillospiraceae bacterium]
MVNLTIDNIAVSVPEGTTILDAAKTLHIEIPHLCYLKDLNEIAACRLCVVEVEGVDRLVTSCNNAVAEGMVVNTNSPRVRAARRTNIQLILSQHDSECTACVRNGNCTLQSTARDLNIYSLAYDKNVKKRAWDKNLPLIRDESKCIKCMRCVQVCDKIQTVNIWDVSGTGTRTTVDVSHNRALDNSECTYCGQCITHCPVGALRERDDTSRVMAAIHDPEVVTVVQVAPAVRAAWGESLGVNREFASAERMVSALKRVGFDYVFDTNFTADLTIMEEGSEFIERFTHKEEHKWPMFTSCCPGWIRFIKSQYPMFTDNLSTAKSPQQMFGAVAKSYFAEKMGIDPHKMFVVSIMPCLAKKSEAALPQMNDACGDPDVDVVLTTREMDRLFRSEHVPIQHLPETPFDSPLGSGTGAAVIFGATGGVMDAALRSAYYLITGENPPADAFKDVRGIKGRKEATFSIPGAGDVRVAVVSGLRNTRFLMRDIRAGRASFDFVEIMACPGGCAGGGGQPIHEGLELAEERGDVLWQLDSDAPIRYSHENSDVLAIYEEYFKAPLGERSHHLLHTDHHCWEMPPKKKPKYKF